jgi:hypothetical protein
VSVGEIGGGDVSCDTEVMGWDSLHDVDKGALEEGLELYHVDCQLHGAAQLAQALVDGADLRYEVGRNELGAARLRAIR